MTHVMWVDADEDHVLINTEVHRAKFRAVETRPAGRGDDLGQGRFVRVRRGRGRVVEIVHGPEARAHIDALSRKYRGRDDDPGIIRSERVILCIEPDVQRMH